MMTSEDLRIQKGISRGPAFHIEIDGQTVTAYAGETIATAMIAAGYRLIRHSSNLGEPRGLNCGMGLCYECRVTVNGRPNLQACITPAEPGDSVERQL
jgi:aerobic-type carbon monoxide dehydrogenase small subunit (CoxS/CutS family)